MLKKIIDKTANVCVLGISRGSLDFALLNAAEGFHCTCIDYDKELVKAINNAVNPFRRGKDNELARMSLAGKISGTDDFSVIGNFDMVVIGHSASRTASSTSSLKTVAKEISGRIKTGSIVLLESSAYTWEDLDSIIPILELSGMRENQDFYVGMTLGRPNNRQ